MFYGAYPGTVVVEPVHAVVAETAVGGAWRPEDLAGEAVLELHRLALDQHLFCSWRWPIRGTIQRIGHLCKGMTIRFWASALPCGHVYVLTNLFLDVRRLIVTGPGNDARVGKRRAEQ